MTTKRLRCAAFVLIGLSAATAPAAASDWAREPREVREARPDVCIDVALATATALRPNAAPEQIVELVVGVCDVDIKNAIRQATAKTNNADLASVPAQSDELRRIVANEITKMRPDLIAEAEAALEAAHRLMQ